jgi:hypothetical protein
MPLLSLVGVCRWLGARQRLLAPKLTVVGPASQAGAAIHGALQQVPSLARSVLQPRRDRPFAKAREPVDGRGGAVDRLRLGGCRVGLDRVVAEVVCAALGHRVVPDEGREHQVRCDQVIDHIPHGPFSARRRRIPLVAGCWQSDRPTAALARTRSSTEARNALRDYDLTRRAAERFPVGRAAHVGGALDCAGTGETRNETCWVTAGAAVTRWPGRWRCCRAPKPAPPASPGTYPTWRVAATTARCHEPGQESLVVVVAGGN